MSSKKWNIAQIFGTTYKELPVPNGEGGNADVYFLQNIITGEEVALKKLNTGDKRKKKRFEDEIDFVSANQDKIPGILPILSYEKTDYWYIMPRAISLEDYLGEKRDIKQIVECIINYAKTLECIHALGNSHRDIKPENMYFYKDHFCLGDFGLVDIPDNPNNNTEGEHQVGAKATMAPEMRRSPLTSSGDKADVYSLAKTLWILITRKSLGFDGVYDFMDPFLSIRPYVSQVDRLISLAGIERLLRKSTQNAPEDRPTMTEFRTRLEKWLETTNDVMRMQEEEWEFLEENLFINTHPQSAVWDSLDDIRWVLQVIARSSCMNHMLYSEVGGLDLKDVDYAPEQGMLELNADGYIEICKPKCLRFERFENASWNYFTLELCEIPGVLKDLKEECLVEDVPAHYVCADDAVYRVYDYDSGEPLPETARVVHRLTSGKMMIVMKMGSYNAIAATYDGRHARLTDSQLRDYITLLMFSNSLRFNLDDVANEFFLAVGGVPDCEEDVSTEEVDNRPILPSDYVSEHYKEWKFEEIIGMVKPQSNPSMYYTLELRFRQTSSYMDIVVRTPILLSEDGEFVADCKNPLRIYDIGNVQTIWIAVRDKIETYCSDYRMSLMGDAYVQIHLSKCRKPQHLFTFDEVRDIMKKADDRKGNRLVVDGDGYVHCLEGKTAFVEQLYPVYTSFWNPYNNYTGKYSDYPDDRREYVDMLSGWLRYLKLRKGSHKAETYDTPNEEELIKEIQAYY